MKSKTDSIQWIPLWVDKWIFGTTRIELEPDKRSVWVDFMAVAAKDHGFIRANVGVAYPPQQLSGLLCITEELLLRTIEKCIKVGKVCKCENGGGYYLPSWGEYALSERHKRRFKEKIEQIQALSAKTDMVVKKPATIYIEENIKKSRGEAPKPEKKDFMTSLKENPAYSHIDIENELSKMDAWLLMPRNKGRKKTSRFILNWLNKIEKPMKIKPRAGDDYPTYKQVMKHQGLSEEDFTWKDK